MAGRISRSIQVAKESYEVLRSNPALSLFPVLSTLANIVVSLPFAVPIVLVAIGRHTVNHSDTFDALEWILTACLYFANYFVVIFFNSALVACANEQLNGRKATVAFGVDYAMKLLPQILGWTLIASTIGLALKFIGERTGIIGRVVTGLIGMVWNIAVFFVVPTLVIERVGPIEAVKTSSGMIKNTWGERIILGVGMGTIFGLLCLIAVVPFGIAVALLVAEQWVLACFMILLTLSYLATIGVIASALNSIFQTALFIYSRTGVVPNGFQAASIQGAFREKPARMVFGRRF